MRRRLRELLAQRVARPGSSAPPWTFAGTAPLVSDGMTGSYLEAATNAAARVVFPGAVFGSFTLSAWISPERNDTPVFGVGDSVSQSLFIGVLEDSAPHDSMQCGLSNFPEAGVSLNAFGVLTSGDHIAVTCDGSDIALYVNGSLAETKAVPLGTPVAQDLFRLMAFGSSDVWLGTIRSPAIFDRALTGDVAAICGAGPDWDLRVPFEEYLDPMFYPGDPPAHWWPALGDTLPAVIDRGLVGGCNLTANGGITIGSP